MERRPSLLQSFPLWSALSHQSFMHQLDFYWQGTCNPLYLVFEFYLDVFDFCQKSLWKVITLLLCKACLGFLRGLKSFDMIPGWFDNHWIIFKATTWLHMIIRQIFVAFLDNLNFTAQKNRMPKLRLLLLAIWLDTIYEPAK